MQENSRPMAVNIGYTVTSNRALVLLCFGFYSLLVVGPFCTFEIRVSESICETNNSLSLSGSHSLLIDVSYATSLSLPLPQSLSCSPTLSCLLSDPLFSAVRVSLLCSLALTLS